MFLTSVSLRSRTAMVAWATAMLRHSDGLSSLNQIAWMACALVMATTKPITADKANPTDNFCQLNSASTFGRRPQKKPTSTTSSSKPIIVASGPHAPGEPVSVSSTVIVAPSNAARSAPSGPGPSSWPASLIVASSSDRERLRLLAAEEHPGELVAAVQELVERGRQVRVRHPDRA